jgi:hypothetical protein
LLIDLGHIKPTMMFAVMNMQGGDTVCHKHWTPEFCIRKTDFSSEGLSAERTNLPTLFAKIRRLLFG